MNDKGTHKAVQTRHLDNHTGRQAVVVLNNADAPHDLTPVHTDRHLYPNRAAAEQAAKARLAALNRSTAHLRLEMPGRTDLFVERTLDAQGFKPGLDGAYLIESVEQSFSASGWSTTVECNGGKQGKATAKGAGSKATSSLKVGQR